MIKRRRSTTGRRCAPLAPFGRSRSSTETRRSSCREGRPAVATRRPTRTVRPHPAYGQARDVDGRAYLKRLGDRASPTRPTGGGGYPPGQGGGRVRESPGEGARPSPLPLSAGVSLPTTTEQTAEHLEPAAGHGPTSVRRHEREASRFALAPSTPVRAPSPARQPAFLHRQPLLDDQAERPAPAEVLHRQLSIQ